MTIDQPLMRFSLLFVISSSFFFDYFLLMLYLAFGNLGRELGERNGPSFGVQRCLRSRSWAVNWLLGRKVAQENAPMGLLCEGFNNIRVSFSLLHSFFICSPS